jgi:hypothetical protein
MPSRQILIWFTAALVSSMVDGLIAPCAANVGFAAARKATDVAAKKAPSLGAVFLASFRGLVGKEENLIPDEDWSLETNNWCSKLLQCFIFMNAPTI